MASHGHTAMGRRSGSPQLISQPSFSIGLQWELSTRWQCNTTHPTIPLAHDSWLTFPSSQEWCPWFCAAIVGTKASPAQTEVITGGLPGSSLPGLRGQRAKSNSVALTLLVGHWKKQGMSLWSHQAWRTMVVLFGQNGRLLRDQIWYLCLTKLYLIEKVILLQYVGYL